MAVAQKPATGAEAIGKSRIYRKFSNLERYQHALYMLDQYCGTTITCRYTIPPSLRNVSHRSQVLSKLERCIAKAVSDHPAMICAIMDGSSRKPSWISIESIDLTKHVLWHEIKTSENYEESLHEETLSQLDTKFDDIERRPSWRVVLSYSETDLSAIDVLLCWHHAAMDGMGGKIFHQSLLHHLNNTPQDQLPVLQSNVLLVQPIERFPPPPESLHRFPISNYYALSTGWKELKPSMFAKPDAKTAAWAPIVNSHAKTRGVLFTVEDPTVRLLIQKCRAYKTTMTGLLHALVMLSLARQLTPEQAPSLSSISALDIRRFLPVAPPEFPWFDPNQTATNYVSFVDHLFPANQVSNIRRSFPVSEIELNEEVEKLVWTAAAQARSEIQVRLDKGLKDDIVGLMKLAPDFRSQLKQQAKKPRPGSWSVTNVGILDGSCVATNGSEAPDGVASEVLQNGHEDVKGEWTIERGAFQLSAEVLSPVFHVSVMSIKGRDMTLDVSWQEAACDANIGEKLAKDLETWLQQLGKQPG